MKLRWILSACTIVAMAALAHGDETPAATYEAAVAPLLNKYCVGCHSSDDAEAELNLESFEALNRGSENGPVLSPGKPDESRLLLVLTGDEEPAMPPEGSEGPSPLEIAALRAWVEAGAPAPESGDGAPAELVVPQVPLKVRPPQAIHSATWSPDGNTIAVGGYRQVRLLDAAGRGVIRTVPATSGTVTDVVFSADGKHLFAAGGEPGLFGEVAMIEVESGNPVRTFKGHKDSLYAVAVSPDGAHLATGSYDQWILLWDLNSGVQVGSFEGHSGAVFDLAFSPNGRLLASASADRTVKLWEVATRTRLDTFAQALQELNTVAFRPDGRQVAAAGADNRIRIWEISESAQEGTNPLLYSTFAHQTPIIKLIYSPNGKMLASVAEDRTLRLFDSGQLTELRSLERQTDWAPALAFSPNSKQLFAGRADGSFSIYDVATGEPAPPAKPELAAVEPRGMERGKTTRLTLTGKHLLAATSVDAGSEQITLAIVPDGFSEAGDRMTVEITPHHDTPRATYELAVVTPGGKTAPQKIYVDDIPQLAETEPNNAPHEASVVELPVSYWGALSQPGDVDYFRFHGNQGETVVIEVSAKSLGGSKLNGVLTLYDASGAVIASHNEFEGDDPLMAYTLPASGVYTVRVSDLTLGGSPEHTYRLSMGSFPYVTGVFPLGVPANSESSVELIGYNLSDDRHVTLPATASGEIVVPIDAHRYRNYRPLKVLVGTLPEVTEAEPNDDPQQAMLVAAPVTVHGRIQTSDDVDLFRFETQAGRRWMIETEAARRGSPIDTKIEVLDAQGRHIERVLLQAVRDSAVNFRNINSQVPEVRVDNWEEMELNEYLYMGGEVCKIFRLPQGPDSGFQFYALGGSRLCYFDTSGTSHAVDDACYIVEPHPPGTSLPNNGLPVFTVYYINDDDGQRRLGRDSRLMFTAPADGEYLVRVTDVRSFGGDRFAYRLTIREPEPGFNVSVSGTNPTVPAGGGRNITFNVDRIDGFDDEIQLDISNVPAGFAVSTPVIVQAGHYSASAVVYAAPDAVKPSPEQGKGCQVEATAIINGAAVSRPVSGVGEIRLAPRAKVSVRIEPAELTIAPGGQVTALLKVDRNGYDGRIRFDMQNLPHGVIVDNIGLNGVLIPEGQSEREIFLTARNWVPETARQFFALTQEPGGEASPPSILHVRRPSAIAQADDSRATDQQ